MQNNHRLGLGLLMVFSLTATDVMALPVQQPEPRTVPKRNTIPGGLKPVDEALIAPGKSADDVTYNNNYLLVVPPRNTLSVSDPAQGSAAINYNELPNPGTVVTVSVPQRNYIQNYKEAQPFGKFNYDQLPGDPHQWQKIKERVYPSSKTLNPKNISGPYNPLGTIVKNAEDDKNKPAPTKPGIPK